MRRHVVATALIALGVVACAGLAVAAGAGPASTPVPAGHVSAPPGHASAAAARKGAPTTPVKLIDINSASRAQLKTLPGIGDAEVDKIIAGRPYLSKAHLVTEGGLPAGVYQSIRHRIVAVQNKAAQAKLKAAAREAAKSKPPASQAR